MGEFQVSIGRVKREISELLNRVAFGGERIVLTSRGKPKAVIVSLEDYERIQQEKAKTQLSQWESWLATNSLLTAKILAERGGEPLDVDAIWAEARADLEERHDYLFDN
ncbi:MAG: type II toxin-antitoxin system Phd/YefM family antitoxin [Anaerolineales bacterium]|nr:type II toxin-antitoxin system Phd/YefM family antitoxin [Anaerolineales bacterium]